MIPLLERCTRAFKDNDLYTNDTRYIGVWVSYADACIDPTDIFQFLKVNRIGEYCAGRPLHHPRWAEFARDWSTGPRDVTFGDATGSV